MKRPTVLIAAALGALACLRPAAADDAAAKPKKLHVVVFDFQSDPPKLGQQLADSLRIRLRRHAEYEVLDQLSTSEVSGPVSASADKDKILALMKDKLGMHVALYGTVTRSGDTVTADACMISLADPKAKEPKTWQKTFSDDTERARGELSQKIVEAMRSSSEWAPPEYGDEAEPTKWPAPVNLNGGFEDGLGGWEHPDNVSTFIEPAQSDGGKGKVLRIRTDLERDKWLEYRRRLRFGLANPNNPPALRRDTSYDSVAGLEGVHYPSDWIKATPGQRYWLVAEMKGKTAGIFFPKIFVKGYRDWSDRADGLPEASLVERKMTAEQFAALPKAQQKRLVAEDAKKHPKRYLRECFRWYLSCRNEEGVWKHYAAPCPPRGGLPDNVEWVQIQVYAYWPPGEFRFDDVHLYKDPRQTALLKVEGSRTPNFGKTSDVVERLEEITAAMKSWNEKRKAAESAGDKPAASKAEAELEKLKKQLEALKKAYEKYQNEAVKE